MRFRIKLLSGAISGIFVLNKFLEHYYCIHNLIYVLNVNDCIQTNLSVTTSFNGRLYYKIIRNHRLVVYLPSNTTSKKLTPLRTRILRY